MEGMLAFTLCCMYVKLERERPGFVRDIAVWGLKNTTRLLCGDAAGAVDPISGEGISFALQTGAAAGRAVAMALSRPAERCVLEIYCADYARVVTALRRRGFWRRFIYPRLVEHLFVLAFRIEQARNWILGQG